MPTLTACKRPEADAQPSPARDTAAPRQKPAVHFGKVTARPLAQTLDISGTLVADETSEAATQVGGLVVSVAIDVGSRVKKGDPLVVLDARNVALQSQAASAAVAQARAKLALQDGASPKGIDPDQVPEVRAAKQSMELAKSEAERVKQLYDQGAVPQSTWDAARTQAQNATAQYEAAVNGIRATVASLTSAQAQAGLASKAVSDTTVRAPFDGAVAEKRISVGEYASPGRVVAVVVRDNPLRLRIDVPEADIANIEVGKPVSVSVASFPGRLFPGVVKRIGASLKASSRTLPVEAEFDNSEGKLRPGLFAQGELTLTGESRTAILVPEAAVGTSGTSARVFVKAGDRVTERLVKPGRKIEGLVEVVGPLSEGEEVAIDKVNELADGIEVAAAQ
ncbi:efflux RND transporter periplasmic adaptor subunit [Sorangium atrum]|uniref:Efflux RND transporter periplasmic adaptor subunit n=1 Tax=Sorangium atrum TaxID=2995308 RepID=A0ABT5C9R4_9BACT|nr:efflux RND transporter periplasmic adaptor subunit [Sorangium aterium]MDC0683169.1 efflux RND transporter periplasmic adaptor subunit [Sorangium aterium]